VAIVIGCVMGFLLGEIVAEILLAIAVQVVHFHGGFSALLKRTNPPWWDNALGLIGLWSGMGAAIVYSRTQGGLKRLDQQWVVRPTDIVYALLGVGCQFIVDLAYAPFHFKGLNKPVNHLFGSAHGLSFAVVALMTTLGAPIVEEWFFRGVLFRALDDGFSRTLRRGASVAAVVLSACIFALAHAEPLQFVGLAFLGIVLAVLVKRTQRLTPSVITHVSFNAVAMISLLAQRAGH
jgi:membrane protease YdiL (CAAX protease family)